MVTPDKKVLVIFHKQLQKFLQPGGHLEITDSGLVNAAQREISEETGLKDPCLHDWCLRNDAPLFIDTHPIPANQAKNEDKHFHHDFMFLFIADTKIVNLDQQEVSEAKWLDTSSLLNANSTVAQALLRATKLGII